MGILFYIYIIFAMGQKVDIQIKHFLNLQNFGFVNEKTLKFVKQPGHKSLLIITNVVNLVWFPLFHPLQLVD